MRLQGPFRPGAGSASCWSIKLSPAEMKKAPGIAQGSVSLAVAVTRRATVPNPHWASTTASYRSIGQSLTGDSEPRPGSESI